LSDLTLDERVRNALPFRVGELAWSSRPSECRRPRRIADRQFSRAQLDLRQGDIRRTRKRQSDTASTAVSTTSATEWSRRKAPRGSTDGTPHLERSL